MPSPTCCPLEEEGGVGEGEGEVGAELGSRDCDTDLGGWEGNHYSELQQLRVCMWQ